MDESPAVELLNLVAARYCILNRLVLDRTTNTGIVVRSMDDLTNQYEVSYSAIGAFMRRTWRAAQ